MDFPNLHRRAFLFGMILLLATTFIFLAMQYSETSKLTIGRLQSWKHVNAVSSSALQSTVSSMEKGNVSSVVLENRHTMRRSLPLIALWQHPFGKSGYGPREGKHCGCYFTYKRSMLIQSDAVTLYCRDADKSNLPPDFPNRTETQLYVWWCLEPPTHLKNWGIDLGYRRGFFNWTMTPRRDSSIRITWGLTDDMKSVMKKENRTLKDLMKLKTKSAIAVVSSCGSVKNTGAKARLRLMNEMKERGLDLDTFGKCFKNLVDGKKLLKSIPHYKFHLSFENSYHCRDYISEKFWIKGIGFGTVPVVWGARKEDYLAIAPESSFIFVEDFNSVDDLVKYLNYLDKNDTAYMKYWEWRSPEKLKNHFHEVRDPPIGTEFINGCELCRHLIKRRESNDTSVSIVPSVEDFYYDPKDQDCFRGARANETYWKFGANG